MTLWENARSTARKGDQEAALALYRELFKEKPQIEEAQREYAILLMNLQKWQEAGRVIQKLLEIEPTSLEYQLYGGRVALVQKRYKSAAKHMGQVYTLSPDGKFSIEALRGQIVALQMMGRNEMAYPLMEQFYQITTHDEAFIRKLAQLSKELGNQEKALTYYKTLLTEFEGTDLDFLDSEPIFETAGDTDMCRECWLQYLEFHPFYIPFHKKLSQYYLANKQGKKALQHLLVRIAHGENNPAIFLQTGKVYLYDEGRPDKALYYYEEYRKRSLHDKHVGKEIKRIQAILANDLLVIVENEGAWNLWRDLAKVIPDRLAVYYSMAEQLEALGKENELLEVLQIIHKHNPDDQKILFSLAQLHFVLGNSIAATDNLDLLENNEKWGRDYFFLRAAIAEQSWDYLQALNFYKQYLLQNPTDYQLILKCIKLAGDIGLMNELNYYVSLLPQDSERSDIIQQGRFLYGEALVLNKLYSMAGDFYRGFKKNKYLTDEGRLRIDKQLIAILQFEEKYFETEQQLRIALIEKSEKRELVQQLIYTNLLQKDWHNAWKWYEFLVSESKSSDGLDAKNRYDLFIEKVSILEYSGQIEVALEMVQDYLSDNEQLCADLLNHCKSLQLKRAELHFKNDDLSAAEAVLAPLIVASPENTELLIFRDCIRKSEESQEADLTGKEIIPTPMLLDYARGYKKYAEYKTALEFCERYLVLMPDSLQARVLRANILLLMGDNYSPLLLFKELALEYPDEKSFTQIFLQLQFKNAKFKDLIEELAPEWKSVKGTKSTISVRKVVPDISSLSITLRILLARAFWADKRTEDALLLYHSLLTPPVDKSFTSELTEQDILLKIVPPKKTFLNTITFTSPAEPDRLEVVMSPEFTRKNLDKPETLVAAQLYSSYRWQQIVSDELSVRQAMVDGNYYQAMKEYQHILSDDSSPESLYDLAGVYSRLGFSGKEAALYEIIQAESPGYPNLDEAMQRNRLKRQPRITPYFRYDKKDGREGYYDIKGRSAGLQAMIFPTLERL